MTYSYFYEGDVPKYHHTHKRIPYVSEVYTNTNPKIYKRECMINTLIKWKDKPYGFHVESYEDEHQTVATNYDIYQELMDGIIDILDDHNKKVSNFDQLEEDVMYYLYHIMV